MSTTAVWRSGGPPAELRRKGFREFVLTASPVPPNEQAEVAYGSGTGFSRFRPITVQLGDAEAIAKHCAYLGRMATEGVVPSAVSAKARRVWEDARKAVPNLPVPAAVAYDGGPIHYTWDNGRHQVTIEVPADGPCEWYVSDRQTGVFDGGDFDIDAGLPEAVVTGLRPTTE